MDSIEMLTVASTNGRDGSEHQRYTSAVGNGEGPGEKDDLLARINGSHGNLVASPAVRRDPARVATPTKMSKVRDELNEVIFWRVRLWMVIVFIAVLVVTVMLVTLALCSVVHQDKDEMFDRSTFKVPRSFSGSFGMPNQVFSQELLVVQSNESQALIGHLQKKLDAVYRASPALGRYFTEAAVSALRNGSVIAEYRLTFHMPAERQDRLRNFTLSGEMVLNVLRQVLYDQEGDGSEPWYIDPLSLRLS